jgi:hypothetical protein
MQIDAYVQDTCAILPSTRQCDIYPGKRLLVAIQVHEHHGGFVVLVRYVPAINICQFQWRFQGEKKARQAVGAGVMAVH